MVIEPIEETVRRFRSSLEQCCDRLGASFSTFPEGCCGDVAELLAAFLKDSGYGSFALISGWRAGTDATSHAWLEKGDMLIDATIDQFSDANGQPVVSRDPTWHAQFAENKECREDGDFRTTDAPHHLDLAYKLLQQHMASRQ